MIKADQTGNLWCDRFIMAETFISQDMRRTLKYATLQLVISVCG